MSKYIIEIAEEYEEYFKGVLICGIADGKFAVDVIAREDLEELNSDYINEHFGSLQDEAYKQGYAEAERIWRAPSSDNEFYQKGLEDGWETARALVWDTSISEYDTAGVNVESWDGETCEVLRRYPAHEAVELLRTVREHKDSDRIEVGDEVRTRDGAPSHTFLVTKLIDSHVYGISDDGSWNYWTKDEVTKTGKHYDIASILEAMRK